MPDGSLDLRNADEAWPGTCSLYRISLRILATTDLHMNIGATTRRGGLARLAPLIAAERSVHENVMLFDNGDLLEGSALADDLARAGLGAHDMHPAVAALNGLGYDAATLGNHDFGHGIGFLRRALRDARYPLTLANAGLIRGAAIWSESLLLHRHFRDEAGQLHDICVGVFGVLPPQTVEWEAGLGQDLATEDVLTASRRAVSSLRARGADVIVALSHGGMGLDEGPRAENAAAAIAGIAGVSAVIAGHTHKVAAHPATPCRAAIVKAGCGGSHLAAISLRLQGGPGEWQITVSKAEALPAAQAPCPDYLANALRLPPDAARRLGSVIGSVDRRLSSHFALLGTDAGLRLTEAALRAHIARALPTSDLPVLAALTPFRSGGRGGPDHFTDIAPGPVRHEDLSALYPFSNHVAAIAVTGAELRRWLDCAAGLFTHLPGPLGPPRPLIDANMPGFQFDMIAGLDYAIDLSRPTNTPEASRIAALRHRGQPVRPGDCFLLITNSYRLSGGPLYGGLTRGKTCLLPETARLGVRDILARHIATPNRPAPDSAPFFRLTGHPGSRVWFDTAPEADPAACPLPVIGTTLTETGFQRMDIRL